MKREILILCSLISGLSACIFEEEGPIYTQGLEWVTSEQALKLKRDKYVVDYESMIESKLVDVAVSEFSNEARKMIAIVQKRMLEINAPEEDPNQKLYFEGGQPDVVSSEIQTTAMFCRFLHEDPVGSDKVTVRVRSRIRLYDVVAKAGSGNFLFEIELRKGEQKLRGYFYLSEFLDLGENGPWSEPSVKFKFVSLSNK